VTHDAFIQQLVSMLRDAEQKRTFGAIEIEIRDGKPVVVREIKTHKLDTGETNRGQRDYR
jgi:hypothetical protein